MEFTEVSVEVVKLGDKKGCVKSVIGKITDRNTRPWLDRSTGKEKVIDQLHMTDLDGKKLLIFCDAGLKNALNSNNIKNDVLIKIEHTGQTALTGGHRVNNYKLFLAE